MKALELTGQRFGKLVVLNRCGSKHGHVAWRCKCDCGREIITIGSHLKSGTSRSCGCVRIVLKNSRIGHWRMDTQMF
jgi:hypothetical protein